MEAGMFFTQNKIQCFTLNHVTVGGVTQSEKQDKHALICGFDILKTIYYLCGESVCVSLGAEQTLSEWGSLTL